MRVHASAKTLAVISAVLALVLSTTTGCCPLLESVSTQTPAEPVEEQVAETTVDPTLDEWARADTRTGSFELTTTFADGRVLVQTGEFWLAGDLIRYDLYEDGELIRSIQTPDGVNAYFVQHADQICEPSVADASYYLRNFSVPSKAAVEDGIDEETGAIRMKYVVQETYAVAGSSNGWYTEDTTYLLTDGQVTGIVTRGCVPEDDGSIGDLQVSRRILTSVEVGGEVPEGTFDLPYPIQDAN